MLKRFCQRALIVCLFHINATAASPNENDTRVSSETCSAIANTLVDAQVFATLRSAANELLDFAALACGLKSDSETAGQVSSKIPDPILVRIPKINLSILWDGQRLSLNEKAESTMSLAMPANFSNIVVIDESEIVASPSRQSAAPQACSGFINCLMNKLGRQSQKLQQIYKNGETHLIFSGYAWHDRSPYTERQRAVLNEQTIGVGIERVQINENGTRESVSVLVFKDSMSNPQFNLAYEIQGRIFKTGSVAAYAGVTAGLLARKQFDYVPLPFVFPSATLSVGKVNLKTVVVPKIGGGVNPGTVVFLFGSVAL